ncbi:MAG: acyl-CoA dehydrogenase [Desulfobacterales bacterium]|nr:acyl-CoA dehydrogenase [Desulfobacterales bacterium]
MAQLIADRRDIDFVLYDQLGIDSLFKTERYREISRPLADMVIDAARQFSIKEILPTHAAGDREGVRYENGQVRVPACFHRAYRHYREGDWLAMAEAVELGGQGLPQVVSQAARDYLTGANFSFAAFGILGHGTGKLIERFGSERQKTLFLTKLYSGEWAGSMLLTEPGAGSDVGALTTTAVRNADGTYNLEGNKIFITCGDHDLTPNIIHPVLARVEGAPEGSKGISIFLVPKIWVNPDGTLGEPNHIACTGIEEKMGLHASPTCSMSLGAGGPCRGLLLGAENQGMPIMFQMMNAARLEVGQQGFLQGSAAYLYAAEYARSRLQGQDLAPGNPADDPVPIIRHPDVRRMLMRMKSLVDGMRSFTFYVAHLFDLEATATDTEERDRYGGLIAFLTPVVKAYCSERGMEVCDLAMNVFGGYGYTKAYPIEQLVRDCKITTIYEGTNGIQAMDLLGRKIGLRKGEIFMFFMQTVRAGIEKTEKIEDLRALGEKLEAALNRYGEVAVYLSKRSRGADVKLAFTQAHPFLDVTGDIILAWMLLERAACAHPRLQALTKQAPDAARIIAANGEAAFLDGQIKTAAYFISTTLPVTIGKIKSIMQADATAIMETAERTFGA